MTLKDEKVCELRTCLGSVLGKEGVPEWLPAFPQACFHSHFHEPNKEQRGPGYGSAHGEDCEHLGATWHADFLQQFAASL